VVETLSSLFDQTALDWAKKKPSFFLRKGKLESRVAYFSLKRISDRVAGGLKEMGLEKGDRVILYMPKSVEAVMIHLGVQKTGGVSVILNPGSKRDEVAYFLKDTDARVIVVGKKEEEVVRTLDAKGLILSIDTESLSLKRNYFHPLFTGHPLLGETSTILLSSSTPRGRRVNPRERSSPSRI